MRALISVSDKSGVVEFAKKLSKLGVEIISTGGTYNLLKESGIDVLKVSNVTEHPEILGGRVKTLHPKVHGGILAKRTQEHLSELNEHNITPIDLVVVNLYPFKETILRTDDLDEAIENIDIGGPTMIRAAAKNFKDVMIVCDPSDYTKVIETLENEEANMDFRYDLALKAFSHTANYDALISEYLRKRANKGLGDTYTKTFEKVDELRYGENPHQRAFVYKSVLDENTSILKGEQLHGKQLSYNNINDANGAIELMCEFSEPTAVNVKHANPCGVATASNVKEAYLKAYEADPVSVFGGIVCLNRTVESDLAKELNKIFIEIVIAPDYTDEALEILKSKKNIRIIKMEIKERSKTWTTKNISGGILVQDSNEELWNKDTLKVVTEKQPNDSEMEDMEFALKVVKHITSNGIVVVKNKQTIGIGNGQVSRIWAMENALSRSNVDLKGSVIASDAFFPFDDCVQMAGEKGICAVVQPGGSMRDEDSVKMADKYGMSMVLTGIRHFKH
nr:bifunctional phosphoribosylaminoimidazolecarboxamide formyltransferase/IMP cyclohydrolase [Anaeromicrobium sediminis]